MTDKDDARPCLGDLLAEGSEWRRRAPPEPPSPTIQAWNPAPLDRALVWFARLHGEDAEQVLQDFRGNTALARLLRKALGHSDMSRDLRAYLMLESLPSDMTAEQKETIVSEVLSSERDALGHRTGGLSPASVKRTARRGRREFEDLEWRRKLDAFAAMFGRKS